MILTSSRISKLTELNGVFLLFGDFVSVNVSINIMFLPPWHTVSLWGKSRCLHCTVFI